MTSGWSRATIAGNREFAPGLHQLTLEVPAVVSSGFHAAGQYHRVRVASGADAYFAIASAPGSSTFEYLVRAHGAAATELSTLSAGAQVEVSAVEGAGFPLEASRGKSLVLIGTGTGFAPLWSVLRDVRRRRSDFGEVHALYGIDTAQHFAWAEEAAALKQEGLHVTPVVERPESTWAGKSGRVQAHLDLVPTRDAVAFLCGHPAMISDVRQLLAERGLGRERTFLNVPE